MIRFGPAGIPLSCKGRTLRDGIADVHHLGLTAMEVQFIKVNHLTRAVLDEEIGKYARELVQQLVVSAGPSDHQGGAPNLAAVTTPLKRRDSVTTLTWSLAKDYADLQQTRALAKALDTDLTLHAPYYVDFFGSADAREQSTRQIQWAGVLAQGLGARLAVTHLGFYGPGDRGDSIQQLTEIVSDLSDWLGKFSKGTCTAGDRAERTSGRLRFARGGPRARASGEGDRSRPQPSPHRGARAHELRGGGAARPGREGVRSRDRRPGVSRTSPGSSSTGQGSSGSLRSSGGSSGSTRSRRSSPNGITT